MRKTIIIGMLVFALVFAGNIVSAEETVTIDFWHAMGGHNGEVLEDIVEDFNESHSDIEVKAQNTGTYNDTLTKTEAAVQSGDAPHIIQIYEIGTQVMVDSDIVVPVEELGKEIVKDDSFDWGKFLPSVANYYSVNGQMQSFPFNSSTPVLYYDKVAFEEAGLDPNDPPQTFEELYEYAEKLTVEDEDGDIDRYGFTLGIVGWFIEQMAANQDALLVNNNNGRDGRATEAYLNEEPVLKFVELWQDMVEDEVMLNPGRGWDPAKQAFLSDRAAMMIESTAQVQNFSEEFAEEDDRELGTAFLPRPEDSERGGVIIGGASLWAIADHPQEELEATWEFLKYITETEQQTHWFENTGYFPVTRGAVEEEMNKQYFSESPDHLTAFLQLLLGKKSTATQGALIGTFPEVREFTEESIEKVLGGDAAPEEALDEANQKVNDSLKEYNSLYE
ncbi:MAG: ABC transporter substrate-binding protein [Bacillota bacterium]